MRSCFCISCNVSGHKIVSSVAVEKSEFETGVVLTPALVLYCVLSETELCVYCMIVFKIHIFMCAQIGIFEHTILTL